MQVSLDQIPVREVLHYLGWHGTPVEQELLDHIADVSREVNRSVQPRVILKRFVIEDGGLLSSTSFCPQGNDVRQMLSSCHEAVLLAATLGAQSERMLLRAQAMSPQRALILDAVLSAAIEEVCDQAEYDLRTAVIRDGLYLTDRFSPGYGNMPMTQTAQICNVLNAANTIGLTVTNSGIMIPRKSVTAILGISRTPVNLRSRGCEVCPMRERCVFSCGKNP